LHLEIGASVTIEISRKNPILIAKFSSHTAEWVGAQECKGRIAAAGDRIDCLEIKPILSPVEVNDDVTPFASKRVSRLIEYKKISIKSTTHLVFANIANQAIVTKNTFEHVIIRPPNRLSSPELPYTESLPASP